MSLPPHSSGALAIMRLSPVIPVVTIDDPADASAVAQALLDGGIGVIELTLRTPRALESAERIAAEVPGIVLGIGTVMTPAQADAAVEAGAAFLVSPGTTPELLRHLAHAPVPALPGVATASETMVALDAGFTELKFFPAGPAGGPAALSGIGGPIPQVTFCPTGGVSPANAADYLRLPNVACVGGSWITPKSAISAHDWPAITALAAESSRR